MKRKGEKKLRYREHIFNTDIIKLPLPYTRQPKNADSRDIPSLYVIKTIDRGRASFDNTAILHSKKKEMKKKERSGELWTSVVKRTKLTVYFTYCCNLSSHRLSESKTNNIN